MGTHLNSCIHIPISKVEALQKLYRFVQISQDNLNFKNILFHCEAIWPFQFGFRKHDCHFYRLHESCFGEHFIKLMPGFFFFFSCTRVLSTKRSYRAVGDFVRVLVPHKILEKHLK